MKLQDKLPSGVTVKGRFYKCDFDFRCVLRMVDVLSQDGLLPEARTYNALKCVMRRPPKAASEALAAIRLILFPAIRKTPDKAKITDMEQDADLIRAAFMQAYGINLYRDHLHWIEFSALLAGLPEGSRYIEVLGIRSRPIPEPTKYNAAERAWLIKAKADLALSIPEEEARRTLANSLRGVAASLLALAESKGGD